MALSNAISPGFVLENRSQAADNNIWQFAMSGSAFRIVPMNDTFTSSGNAIPFKATRTDDDAAIITMESITSINLESPDIKFTGDVEIVDGIYDSGQNNIGALKIRNYTVNFDDTFPLALHTVADGDVIIDVYCEVTTTFDDTSVIDIGDGSTATGFGQLGSGATGSTGYYLTDISDRGSYLYESTDKHALRKVYTGADTIDVDVSSGSPTQGVMTVWVVWQDLK